MHYFCDLPFIHMNAKTKAWYVWSWTQGDIGIPHGADDALDSEDTYFSDVYALSPMSSLNMQFGSLCNASSSMGGILEFQQENNEYKAQCIQIFSNCKKMYCQASMEHGCT